MPTAPPSKRRINECGALLRDLPPGVDTAIGVVESWRSGHREPLARASAALRRHIPGEPEVAQRLKRFDTILHKLRRFPRMELTRMEDIAGVRATLSDQAQVLRLTVALEHAPDWTIRRKRLYIAGGDPGPKLDGYRAVHLIVVQDDRFAEIQLRTIRQDAWGQMVERDTRRLREELKFGGGPEDLRAYYRMAAEQLAMLDTGTEPSQAFTDELNARYADTRRHFRHSRPGT